MTAKARDYRPQAHLRVAEVTSGIKSGRAMPAAASIDRGRAVDIELLAEDPGERPLLGRKSSPRRSGAMRTV